MINETLKDVNVVELILDLLEYEKAINIKKINNEKLTEKEYIFDTFMVKPSTVVKHILNNKGDEKNV